MQDQPLRARYLMIPATLPKGCRIEQVTPARLPADWRGVAAHEALQALGSAWAARMSSPVLTLPSAVIPAATCYLLNPLHPQFGRIEVGEAEELGTALRLAGR